MHPLDPILNRIQQLPLNPSHIPLLVIPYADVKEMFFDLPFEAFYSEITFRQKTQWLQNHFPLVPLMLCSSLKQAKSYYQRHRIASPLILAVQNDPHVPLTQKSHRPNCVLFLTRRPV